MNIRAALSAAALAIGSCAGAIAADEIKPAAETPLSALPYTPSLDLKAMDMAANPCDDFYQYACGGWMKNNPIPADQASWSVYGKLYQDNQRFLWGILDGLAKNGGSGAQRKLGDYFAACMDETAIEKLGAAPLAPSLAQIAALQSARDLPALLSTLHLNTLDEGLFFGFGAAQDYGDASKVIASVGAGGLGLPERDYYTREDAKSKELRRQYLEHLARMFVLLGDKPDSASRNAATVMKMETALAKSRLTKVELRDPYKTYHKMDAKALQALTPDFDWSVYRRGIGAQALDTFNVSEPAFMQTLNRQWKTAPVADLKTYLRWHVAHAQAEYLSKAFVDEDFAFFRKTLRGVPLQKPRWKRCVALVDDQLGESLGQEFVNRSFSPQLKADTLKMARQIEQAMSEDLDQLSWMSPETKKKAVEKLGTIVNKIGYPDSWRDYSALTIARDDFAGNVERGRRFEAQRQLAKIGKPVDRGEWGMTPPTVNAYYDPQMNDINFPAGVLQPPLYDAKMDAAPNYGNTGSTIGHELTHAFDDEGRQFDAQGNLKDWWTPADATAFEERAQCVVDQYSHYVVVDDIKINSKLSEGEDLADLGGLVLGWMAWQAETANQRLRPIDGLNPDQRFFIGYAQWACENNRPENLRANALTDPHSPGKYRVNGLMVNMPEFQAAFSCKAGDAMVGAKRCRVW